ncbi:flavin-containing monooxygenase [Luethyella okanaganae]|uniref:Flavin-containing monooxygenase n=1 Tax=Luethyella okanaganae TaxID=69372 RepID=A0ABW1VDI7_9MICO
MEHIETIVVGAGQAGLAVGHHLARRQMPFTILDAGEHVGDVWRARWDSLRLFTPGRFSSLPGLSNPVGPGGFASKDEFADYLDSYARHFHLPVRSGVRVRAIVRRGDRFELDTTTGTMSANHVVAAGGHNALSHVPNFARDLDPGIRQLHSSAYRNPASIPTGDVLVVGAGTSGAEIALELAATHKVLITGRPTPHVPDAVFRYAGGAYWLIVNRLLTIDTPPGRKVAASFGQRGAPLIRISMQTVEAAGVTLLPRIIGVSDGHPETVAGTISTVATVIWATGYRPNLDWLPPLDVDEVGVPITRRGVVRDLPGLYFVGMPFQYALTSGLIGGVGRDAEHIADQIATYAP